MSNERECILYRWWRADGALLYVGKSISLFARISAHRGSSAFFSSAATMTIERFPNETELAEAEVRAIRDEHPLFNVMHNRGGGSPKMLLPVPSPEKTLASHWVTIEADQILVGDVVRYTFDDEVVLQGLVDDDLYDCDEHDEDDDLCVGWIIWADSGAIELAHAADFGLGTLEKWLSLDSEDATKDRIFSEWLHGRARQIGALVA